MGKFGDSDMDFNNNGTEWGLVSEEDEGGAGIGASLGVMWQYGFPSASGLSLTLSADVILNLLNSNVNEWYDDMIEETEKAETVTEVLVKKPRYLNVPVMAGLQYSTSLKDNVNIYFEGAIGFNIRNITEAETETKGYTVDPLDPTFRYNYNQKETSTFDKMTSFAFRVGGGLIINDKYTIGVGYYNLGKGRVRGDDKQSLTNVSGRTTDKQSFKYKNVVPTLVMVRIGYIF